jgi:hypothetical protein
MSAAAACAFLVQPAERSGIATLSHYWIIFNCGRVKLVEVPPDVMEFDVPTSHACGWTEPVR